MPNEKSSTVFDDEQKKAVNLYNALVNDSKKFFQATDKITKTHAKKQENHYKKDIVFVNNGLGNKTFLPEKVPPNTPFVE